MKKQWVYLEYSLSCTKGSLKCLLIVNAQCYVQTLYDIWSVYTSPNNILLQPFDSVFVSCEFIWDIQWSIRVNMLILYPRPVPLQGNKSREKKTNVFILPHKFDFILIIYLIITTWSMDSTKQRVSSRKGGIDTGYNQYFSKSRVKGQLRVNLVTCPLGYTPLLGFW